MNYTVLLVITTFAYLTGAVLQKHLSGRYGNGSDARYFYNMIVSLTAVIVLYMISDMTTVSFFTVALALAFGLVTLLQQIFNLKALECGPLSYTTVIVSLSTLIPALSGVVFWDETLSTGKVAGILAMVVCFILSVDLKTKASISKKWIISCGVAFFGNGLIGVMQKWHQSSPYRDELAVFLMIAFLCSFLFSAFVWILSRVKKKSGSDVSIEQDPEKKNIYALFPIALMAINGVCLALNHKLNLFLSGVLDSAVFFPIVNGGGLVAVLLASILLFKERPTIQQWIGILFGIVSVLLLCCF